MNPNLRRLAPLLLFLFASGPIFGQAPLPYNPPPTHKKVEVKSFYLEMRDGVQIAVDLLLPKNRQPGEKFPTILHQTRYWRSLDLRWPFQGFIDAGAPSLWVIASTEKLVEQGYAVVSVDARGSGASSGKREMEASKAEIEDAREIMDWIVGQPWADGNIGTIGVSYNGWVALMAAKLQHPALKCVVPISTPFDGFREMVLPGGVYNRFLIDDWTEICDEMDHDILPTTLKAKWLYIKGIDFVEKGKRKQQLEDLYAQRQDNQYADVFMQRLKFRDDTLPELGALRIDSIFPAGYLDAINAANVPIYAIGGWYDLSCGFGSTRMFLNSTHPESKLLLGAWHHGTRLRVSPFNEVTPIPFDRYGEILKFLDRHLKGKDNGIDREPRAHYYHMGAEAWKGTQQWPLPQQRKQIWYLGEDFSLQPLPPSDAGSADSCLLENDTYVGRDGRWELGGRNTSQYDTFLVREPELLQYTTPPAPSALDISGFPQATLYMKVPNAQINVFVYLEDIAPDGTRRVVSQGQVKAGFRKLHQGAAPYADAVPYRRLYREDFLPVDPDAATELPILFHPTSWRLEKGHAVRMVICGSDLPHFEVPGAPNYESLIFRNQNAASRLELPVVIAPVSSREK